MGTATEEKDEEKAVLPEYEGKPTEAVWAEYEGYHRISHEAEVNKPRARERRIRRHRKGLEGIVANLAPDEGSLLEAHKKELDAKKQAAKMIAEIVHEGYKADNPEAKKPKEEGIRRYLREAGVEASYEDVLQEVMNAGDLTEYERLPENLRRLIDHVSLSKDKEGRKIQKLRQTLARYEHIDRARELISEATGKKLSKTANPQQMFEHYDRHISAKDAEYEALRKKTYHEKEGGKEPRILKFPATESKEYKRREAA